MAGNGTPVSPISNFGSPGICCAASSNPILPGTAFYKQAFSIPYPAGPFANWQQIYVTPYSQVAQGGINASTANQFIFALHFTLQSAAAPTVTSVISAGAFGAFPTFRPGSWIEFYGTGFAVSPQTRANSDFNGLKARPDCPGIQHAGRIVYGLDRRFTGDHCLRWAGPELCRTLPVQCGCARGRCRRCRPRDV